jgi:hypothetical protein
VATGTGEDAFELTTGSAGGHVSTEPDPGNVQHPARFVILTYSRARHHASYAVVTVFPDASVTVSPRASLRTPYDESATAGTTAGQ